MQKGMSVSDTSPWALCRTRRQKRPKDDSREDSVRGQKKRGTQAEKNEG